MARACPDSRTTWRFSRRQPAPGRLRRDSRARTCLRCSRAEQSQRPTRAGQAHHLPAPVRRPVAPRHVRHEAGCARRAFAASSSRSRPASRASRSASTCRGSRRCIDQFAQVRSVNHRMKNHNSATYYSLTGHAPPLDDIRLRDTQELYPAYGSTVARLRPVDDPAVPSFVSYPARPPRRQRHAGPARQLPGQGVRPVLHRPGPESIATSGSPS